MRLGVFTRRLLTALALLTPVLGVSSLAGAVAVNVTCIPPSSTTATYSPALTPSSQSVGFTAHRQYSLCVSASQPAITSGISSSSGTVTMNCLDLLRANPFTTTVVWNTGQTSTLTGNRSTSLAGAVLTVTATGTVTSGPFAGDSLLHQELLPSADITLCTLGLGTVSGVSGTVVLEISST